MKKTYTRPLVTASDVVRTTEIGFFTITTEYFTVWHKLFWGE
jgi:hypothetical protein